MRLLVILVVTAGAVLLAACGDDEMSMTAAATAESAPADGSPPQAASDRAPTRTTDLRLQGSDYGEVLFDDRGGALYLFTKEESDASRCYGECAKAWPPFLARGNLRAGPGLDRELLGRTERRDGRKQVTYAGHPLYYYAHDPRNEILCHDVFEFGGDWLVVQASGEPAPS
jgi:predicted lipoprotein with Yx(FWY)xxD motif